MGRFDTSFDETWDVEPSKNKGFPYMFKFSFDREDNRFITDSNETWGSNISKSGRYGVSPDA
jgi:hypothetical protein